MSAPYRICLLGFSAFERGAMLSYFRMATNREPRYEGVESPAEAHFVVVDADDSDAVRQVVMAQRAADAVFVGALAPTGASAWVMRPIDPLHVLRELDAMVTSQTAGGHHRPAATLGVHAPKVTTAILKPRPGGLARRNSDLDEPPTGYHQSGFQRAELALPDMGAWPEPPPAPEPQRWPPRPLGGLDITLPWADEPPVQPDYLRPRAPASQPTPGHGAPAPAARAPLPTADSTPPPRPPAAAAAPVTVWPPMPEPVVHTRPPLHRSPAPPADPAPAPLAAAPAPASRPPAKPAQRVVPPPRGTLALLVDDSEIALRYLETRLQAQGLQTECASGSAKAIELLAHKAYDFVFLDVDLGDESELDGLSLCQHIKRQHRHVGGHREPVVVLVSAHHSQMDRVRGTLAGAEAYLGKPLDDAALARLLQLHGVPLLNPPRQASPPKAREAEPR